MFDELAKAVAAKMAAAVPVERGLPGRFSVWLRFFRHQTGPDGVLMEETVGTTTRVFFTARNAPDLYEELAQNVVLKVYGEEVETTRTLPNLVLKIGLRKEKVALSGAPPLSQPDQVFLKVTVYEYQPSLWERVLGRVPDLEPELRPEN